MTMELIVAHGDVVTMNPSREVLLGGAVLVTDGVIAAVGSSAELLRSRPDAAVIDASRCVVTPGMINAHQHLTGDPLVRSCIPDLLPAGASIFEWSVPLHGAHTPDDDELTTLLCAIESVQNGVTMVVEAGTVAHPERVVDGLQAVGLRGTIGTWGWDIEEGPFAAPADEVLDRQRAVVERWPAGGLVTGWVTLVGHDLASDALLVGAADLARRVGTGMTMHLSPTSSDPERYLARTGRRPVVHLQHLGVLGRHLLLAHGVWFDDEEIDLVLDSGTAIAYCPWAYLRLGQGVTRGDGTPSWWNEADGWRWVATRRTPATWPTSSGPRPRPPASPVTPGSTQSASAPTPRSSWPRSPARRPSGWRTPSARSNRGSRRTSSSTARMGGGGRRAAMSGCSSCGARTVGPSGMS